MCLCTRYGPVPPGCSFLIAGFPEAPSLRTLMAMEIPSTSSFSRRLTACKRLRGFQGTTPMWCSGWTLHVLTKISRILLRSSTTAWRSLWGFVTS